MLFGSDMEKCAESQRKLQCLVQSLQVQERAEWELDHLLKKSSPLFFRSLSLRKSSQIPILMTRNPRESCGSPSFLPSFLPSFEQPKWQRFLANVRH